MSVKDGLSKKEGFTPEKQNPPETKKTERTKANDPMIKRHVKGRSSMKY